MTKWEEEVVLGATSDDDEELRILVRELPMADGVHASTGNQLWTSSVLLARLIVERCELFRGRRVMEMGAGCGLCGIVAARFARQTKITDGDAEVVDNIRHNVQVNRSVWQAWDFEDVREVVAEQLDWDAIPDLAPQERSDVIFASDIIYGFWGDSVGRAMLNMLAPGGTILLVCSEDRRCGVAAFKEYLGHSSFRVEETKFKLPIGTFRLFECRASPPGEPVRHPELVERTDWRPSTWVPTSPDAFGEAPAAVLPSVGWCVVGGLAQGGIIVRDGIDGKLSKFKGRLEHGAVVEEVEKTAERLKYRKRSGKGPQTGWVTFVSGRGAQLLTRLAA